MVLLCSLRQTPSIAFLLFGSDANEKGKSNADKLFKIIIKSRIHTKSIGAVIILWQLITFFSKLIFENTYAKKGA